MEPLGEAMMKYLIVIFSLYPGGKLWDYKILDALQFLTEKACEESGQLFDGVLADGTLIIHNCIKDTNGQSL